MSLFPPPAPQKNIKEKEHCGVEQENVLQIKLFPQFT